MPLSKMKIGAFLYPTGYHIAAWRMPGVPQDAGVNFRHFVDLAKKAEAAGMDFLFLADSLATQGNDIDALSRTAIRYVSQFEPLTLLAALASHTSRIGLVSTASTTYNDPYTLARKLLTIDHISEGRVGWNAVTGSNVFEAGNYGLKNHPEHSKRYERADEFLHVVNGLWNSWDHDAFVRNKETGLFFDPEKRHPLNHEGSFFNVKGPLNLPPSQQNYPIIYQSGSSDAGINLAAKYGEVAFVAASTLEEAKSYSLRLRRKIDNSYNGRKPIKILPGIMPFIGKTESEAQEKFHALQAKIHPEVGLSLLSGLLANVKLDNLDLDGPLPDIPKTNASQSRQSLLIKLAQDNNFTIRQLYLHIAAGRGHLQVIGTPQRVADVMEEWFVAANIDGFNIIPHSLPMALDDTIELLLPELQRRGLYDAKYECTTLRGNLNSC